MKASWCQYIDLDCLSFFFPKSPQVTTVDGWARRSLCGYSPSYVRQFLIPTSIIETVSSDAFRNQFETTEGLFIDVFDYSTAICMRLTSPKNERHSWKDKWGLEIVARCADKEQRDHLHRSIVQGGYLPLDKERHSHALTLMNNVSVKCTWPTLNEPSAIAGEPLLTMKNQLIAISRQTQSSFRERRSLKWMIDVPWTGQAILSLSKISRC